MDSGAGVDVTRRSPRYRSMRVWLWAMNLPAEPTLAGSPPGSPSEASRLRCRLVDPSEARSLAAALAFPLDGTIERQTWCRCYAGHLDSQVVNCGWVSDVDTWVGEIASTIRPGDHEAYIWDCRTLPEYRRRGFYRDLLGQIIAGLAGAGYRRAWIATVERNSAGSRGVARAGFHPVLRIRCVQLGPVRWCSVRPARGPDEEEIRAARRALRLGQRPERVASTRPRGAPPAPVPR